MSDGLVVSSLSIEDRQFGLLKKFMNAGRMHVLAKVSVVWEDDRSIHNSDEAVGS